MRIEAELYDLCKDFIRENEIYSEDTIYQSDRIESNALEFIAQICDLLGYYEPDEEDDYED